jgi:predicted nucleotidyltransferase
MAPALRLLDILQVLGRHGVDFILVGGVAAVLEGAPVATFDLDIVPDPTPENRGRLLEALRELNARYLDPAGRHFVPDEAKLASMRLHQLLTDAGPLDVLTTIGTGMTYTDLTGRTRDVEVAGHRFRCLKLDAVIESKEQANREKDRAVLPILRRTLQQKKEKAEPG